MTSTPQDPRNKNTWFDSSSIASYLDGYRHALCEALGKVDTKALELTCKKIEEVTAQGGHIYAIGNGGSSAIADHLCCDWTKGTHTHNSPTILSHSLSANGALFTAVANDFGFENSFSRQVEFFGKKGDLLIAISSSGNSENILRAVRTAKERGLATVGLSGFEGGSLHKEADISLFVGVKNYGLVEDAHQALMHVIAQYIVTQREKR